MNSNQRNFWKVAPGILKIYLSCCENQIVVLNMAPLMKSFFNNVFKMPQILNFYLEIVLVPFQIQNLFKKHQE